MGLTIFPYGINALSIKYPFIIITENASIFYENRPILTVLKHNCNIFVTISKKLVALRFYLIFKGTIFQLFSYI